MAGRATYDDFTGGDSGSGGFLQDDGVLPGVSEGPLFGRGGEARVLLDLLDPRRPGGREVVAVVMGPPGTGRSALVSRVAREAAARGWFPGGVLRLPAPGALSPGAHRPPDVAVAVAAVLRFLGLPDRQLPPEAGASDAMTRFLLSSLANPGERRLVIAEDVTDATELQFLLSVETPPVLLVTAVDFPDLTAAATLRLGPLAEDSAARLITDALPSTGPTDSHRPGGSDGLRELVAGCGRLPSALVAARALLAGHPELSFAALAAELTASGTKAKAGAGAGQRAFLPFLTGVLNAALRRLAPGQAEALRLLARAPGDEWSTQAIAALIGCSPAEVTELLALPARLRLVERYGGGEGHTGGDRWRLSAHLPWDRAQTSSPSGPAVTDQDEAALDRLLQHYDDLSAAADRHVRGRAADPAGPSPFADRDQALGWLEAQRGTLLAAVRHAAASGRAAVATSLAIHVTEFLVQGRRHHDVLMVCGTALEASLAAGQANSVSSLVNNAALALSGVGLHDEAIAAFDWVAEACQTAGDAEGTAVALSNKGAVLHSAGRLEEAHSALTFARYVSRENRDEHGEGAVLNNLAMVLRELGDLEGALEALATDLGACVTTGDQRGTAQTLVNLASVLSESERPEDAAAAAARAAALFGELGDPHQQAMALSNLGSLLLNLGRDEQAVDVLDASAVRFAEAGDPAGSLTPLRQLARAHDSAGRRLEAWAVHSRCLTVASAVGDVKSAAEALGSLGSILMAAGQFEEAIAAHAQDLAICRSIGDRAGEGQAQGNLGLALLEAGRVEDAVAAQIASREISRELGNLRSEGMACANLGAALARAGRTGEAETALKRALEIFSGEEDALYAHEVSRRLAELAARE